MYTPAGNIDFAGTTFKVIDQYYIVRVGEAVQAVFTAAQIYGAAVLEKEVENER